MLNARAMLGSHDVLFVSFDTLRYDVARHQWEQGHTPNLCRWLPPEGWERRHTPSSFTYGAHQAFFAGFLPTPARPGLHQRLFAARFAGSETTGKETLVFDSADIVSGFAAHGYRTICIGGVGFFNRLTPLGSVLPDLFQESHWSPELATGAVHSTRAQVTLALGRLTALDATKRVFLFMNVSAVHQPNHHYLHGAEADSLASHAAALSYVDSQLPPLLAGMRSRAPLLCVFCSDHGTAYGEGGYSGHRIGHPVVWDVPYAEFVLEQERSQ